MGRYTFAMRRHTSRLVFLGLVTAVCACAPMPDGGQTFQGMQAEQAAIQSILNQGTSGTAATWQDPDGVQGTVTITGSPDADGCRTVETQGPRGQNTDRWCPTAHGFWVHPDERFYRNATGHETYGGAVRSRETDTGSSSRTDVHEPRPGQIDCLRLFREERRLSDDGRAGAARAKNRAYHTCLHRSN